MRLKRRRLLSLILASAALPGTLLIWSRTRSEPDFLASFCDTILPGDEFASASEAGAHLRIKERAAADNRFATILSDSTAAINNMCLEAFGAKFVALGQDQKNSIIRTLDDIPETNMQGWIFRAVRGDFFFYYYALPESWALVGVTDTPQPNGHENVTTLWDRNG